ncbi:unnamed protein product [Trichobilharzia szidati]|nr:unnamed protein product [Trichobilharzia szidati]
MSHSQPNYTLEEYLSSTPSEVTTASLKSSNLGSLSSDQMFNRRTNALNSCKQSILKGGLKDTKSIDGWPLSSNQQDAIKSLIKANPSNLSSRQQLRRSNTVGPTDVTKTEDGKLLLNNLFNKSFRNRPVDEVIQNARQLSRPSVSTGLLTFTGGQSSANDNINVTQLNKRFGQQRYLYRAQSEHHFRASNTSCANTNTTTTTTTANNNNGHSQQPRLFSQERNDVPSTFRSIFSQRGYNFGKSLWQQNFSLDEGEQKATLGGSNGRQMSTASTLLRRNRLKKETTVDNNLLLDHRGFSLSENTNHNRFVNGHCLGRSMSSVSTLLASTSSAAVSLSQLHLTSAEMTTQTTITATSSNGCNSNELRSEKFVEDFLKKPVLSQTLKRNLSDQNEPIHLSNSFSGQTLVQWFCRQIIQSGCPWSYSLISVVCQFCNCLLRLGVLRRDSKSKPINSTSSSVTPGKPFPVFSRDSERNTSEPAEENSVSDPVETFELNMEYTWTAFNETSVTAKDDGEQYDVSHQMEQQQQQHQQQNQQTGEYKTLQIALHNHLVNLHKEFEYELDRLTREHELQLFKVKNQGVMKVCQLTDRIEALENQVEKYRILAGIEHLTKSSMLEESSQVNLNNHVHSHYSPMFTSNYSKDRLSKVKFSLPDEILINYPPRNVRASSEISDVSHSLQRNLHFITGTYGRPDYMHLSRTLSNEDQQLNKPLSPDYRYLLQQKQQEQNQPDHTQSEAADMHRINEMSVLKNLIQKKSNSFIVQDKDLSNKLNRSNLGTYLSDNRLTNEDTRVQNNDNSRPIEDRNGCANEDNSHSHQKFDRTNPRNLNVRYASAPPISKTGLSQTTSATSSQPILGIQTKYDTGKCTLKKMSKDGEERIKGVKEIKRNDKNRGLT